MKAVVATFNQEKALVGAFSVLTNLRMELFQALLVHSLLVTSRSFPRTSQDDSLWRTPPGSDSGLSLWASFAFLHWKISQILLFLELSTENINV